MKKIYIFLPVLTLFVLLGAGTALACNGSKAKGNLNSVKMGQFAQSRLTQEATILGLTADDLKSQLSSGKKISDIIATKGMTQDQFKAAMKAARQAQIKQQLQDLVSQGKITLAQADARLKSIQDKQTNGSNFFGGQGRRTTNKKPTTTKQP